MKTERQRTVKHKRPQCQQGSLYMIQDKHRKQEHAVKEKTLQLVSSAQLHDFNTSHGCFFPNEKNPFQHPLQKTRSKTAAEQWLLEEFSLDVIYSDDKTEAMKKKKIKSQKWERFKGWNKLCCLCQHGVTDTPCSCPESESDTNASWRTALTFPSFTAGQQMRKWQVNCSINCLKK